MTWAVVKMHSEASAMMVERRDEVFILKGVGLLLLVLLLLVLLLLLRIWELGVGSLVGIVGGQLWRIDGWLVCVMVSELDSWNGMEWRRS